MTQKPTYYDKRSGFWRRHFDQAAEYEEFLENEDKHHTERWRETMSRLPDLTPEQVAEWKAAAEGLQLGRCC